MNIQSLGQLVIKRKKVEISEEDINKRRDQLEQQKGLQKKEMKRLSALLVGPPTERKDSDTNSFIEHYGTLSFFREYLQEGHKALVRTTFMKGELKSYLKGEFITLKGDKNQSMKVILEGQVGLFMEMTDSKSGKRQLLMVRKMFAGESIEIGTLIENSNYVMTTQAITDKVELISLGSQHFVNSFYRYESEKYEADIEFLRGVPFFKEWPKKNLNSLQMCLNKFQVSRSQVIFQEGQASHALFIVKKGEFGLYKKRQTWMKSSNLPGETTQDKLNNLEDAGKDLFGNDLLAKSTPITPVASSKIIPSETNLSQASTLFQGKSKLDVVRKISGFLATSAVEMNSDLLQTLTEFDSFGEKELLDGGARQCSVVCRSQTGELIQLKSKHFFVLAQEEPTLKYSIMTKMMVESKKSQLQNMRNSLSFRNENQLSILDNQLQSMGNIQQFSEKFNVFHGGSNNNHENDMPNIDGSGNNTPSLGLPRISRFGINGGIPGSHLHTKSFSINKLLINPNPNDDTRFNVAQLYYQMSKTKREKLHQSQQSSQQLQEQQQQQQQQQQSPAGQVQSQQFQDKQVNQPQQQQQQSDEMNLSSYLISKQPVIANHNHDELHQRTNSKTNTFNNSIQDTTLKTQQLSEQNTQTINSSQLLNTEQQQFKHQSQAKSLQRQSQQLISTQPKPSQKRIGSASCRRSDSMRKSLPEESTPLIYSSFKLPYVGSIHRSNEASNGTTPIAGNTFKSNNGIIKGFLPQTTGCFSSFCEKTMSHHGSQQFSSYFEKSQSHHTIGQPFKQNPNIFVKRSFLLENEPRTEKEIKLESVGAKINRFPVDSASLPSRDFSSRPLINSIAYSQMQLKI